jgi:chemotaxis protein methyltransferase CheR
MDVHLVDAFRAIAHAKAGIDIPPGKEDLIAIRVGRRLKALGLKHASDYLAKLRADPHGTELTEFLNAISTNLTAFFREADHFDLLADDLARRAAATGRLRIWCAASSTGEEPYTLAMVLAERLGGSVDIRILGTDISTDVLRTAEAGVYRNERVAAVPSALRARYFDRVDDEHCAVSPVLRQMVVFGRLNLSTPPFPMQGPLDAVLCRNVMIYFDQDVKQRLIADVEHRLLAPGALFVIGHAESLNGLTTGLKFEAPSVYRAPRAR